jgi:hypothetical protein
MIRENDLLPWIVGGLSLATIAIAVTVTSINRSVPKVVPAAVQAAVVAPAQAPVPAAAPIA